MAAQGEREIVQGRDRDVAESYDHVPGTHAGLLRGAARPDTGDPDTRRLPFGEVRDHAEERAVATPTLARRRRDLHVRRRCRLRGDGRDYAGGEDRHGFEPLRVQLLPCVGRAVVVTVSSGEEEEHGPPGRVEGRV